MFGGKADTILNLYPGTTGDQAKRSAQDLAGDQFIGVVMLKGQRVL